jgi:hypothetical protein
LRNSLAARKRPVSWSLLVDRFAPKGFLGIVAPFRLRPGHVGLMTVSAAALAIWAMLQGV